MTTTVRILILLIALALPAVATAQDAPLPDLSLTDLMQVEVQRVFGASERMQPVTEAPASVTIITADDISRFGYRTLADILRSVRGFYVTNDRNYSYLGARGFAKAGDYNTRLLLLINGHRVNDNVFDQASIGGEFGLDVDTVERVEIIRGPASSLYGTNAFFGVVNVVTQTGQSLNGTSVHVDAGTLDTQRARVAAGKRLANGLDFALSASFERSGGMHELYFPAFDAPETNNGIAEGLDAERQSGVYGRISFKDLTVTGASGSRRKDVPTASFGALFNAHDPAENTTDVHSFIDALYDRPFGATRLSLRASWDRVTYAGTYPYASEDENLPVLILDDGSLGTRLTIDAKATRVLPGRQTLTVGAEFFDNFQQNLWLHYRDSDIPDEDINRSSRQGAVFAQDEIALRRWLLLTAGVRYDAFEAFSRVTPRGAVIVVPSSNQSFKYLYGKAFRAPNAYELYYFPLTRPDLAPESIDTHEIVWEQYVGEWLRTSVSTYFYEASQLISLAILDPDDSFEGLGFVNQGAVSARGLELEAEMRFKRGVRGQASYALQRATDEDLGTSLTNSPRHMAKVQLSVPGPLARSLASFELQYLSRRGTLAGATVAPQALAHVTLSAPISRSLDVVGTIRNLFDQRYADPASDEHQLDAIEQNGRTMNVGLRWKIGKP